MAEGHFVDDLNDPGQQGMFSKAGRYKTEQNIIFQRKDEILYGKKSMRVSHSQPQFQQPKVDVNNLNAKLNTTTKKGELEGKIEKEKNPFYKQLSREYVGTIKNSKPISKPVGTYQPNYRQIDKSQHLVWNILKVHSSQTIPKIPPIHLPADDTEDELKKFYQKFPHAKKPVAPRDTLDEDMRRSVPEKMQSKIHALVELDRCIDRCDVLTNQKDNPHPARFEPFQLSRTWSNIRKIPSVYLEKTMGREVGGVYKNKEHQPDYNPNYEFSKKQLSNTGPPIATRPPRKTMIKPYATKYEDFYDFDGYVRKQNNSRIFRNQSTFFFDKQLPREIDSGSPLPSFMQKHVNLRSTLTQLHHKMLEENHFFEGRFQSTGSDFMRSQDKFRKNDKEVEEEEESLELETNQ